MFWQVRTIGGIMAVWKMMDAKIHLSKLVQEVLNGNPQFITLKGKPAVVVISQSEYDSLVKKNISSSKTI